MAILLAAWTVRRAWPREGGRIDVPGLTAPVEVVRDHWGVPQVHATNGRDLVFARLIPPYPPGGPLLANDTHLGLGMPSPWSEIGLHGGLNADVQEVYFEQLDEPERPTAALFQGRWEKLARTTERIPVKGTEPEIYEVLESRHGPLIPEVQPDWQDTPPMALAGAASDGSRMMDALALLGRAGSWPELRGALSHWDTPSLNFVYADVDGHIGHQSTARVPRRAPGHDGGVPAAGWDGRCEGKRRIGNDVEAAG